MKSSLSIPVICFNPRNNRIIAHTVKPALGTPITTHPHADTFPIPSVNSVVPGTFPFRKYNARK